MLLSIINKQKVDPLNSKHKIGKQITLIGLIGFIILAIFNSQKNSTLVTFISCITMCLFCYTYLCYSYNYKIAYWFLSILTSVIIQYTTNVLHEDHITHYPDFLWIIPCILIAFYGLGTKAGFLFFGVNILGIAYFIFFEMNNHIKNAELQSVPLMWSLFLEILMCLIVIGSFIWYYNKSNNNNINKLKKLNEELAIKNKLIIEQNNEKTILIKEIHHRVKNNLQIIVSLLRLQFKDSNDDTKLIELTNRVHSMSLIHQKLYQNEDLSSLRLSDYIVDLFEHIKHIFVIDKNIILKLDSSVDNIKYENMIPIGLILNELISNSFKYAFQNNNVIHIKIKKYKKNKTIIQYNDFSDYNLFNNNRPGFGIELIKSLVEQINGELLEKKTTKEVIF